MHSIIAAIIEAFEQKGSDRYGAESVTQLQHALQCGQLARQDGANAALVTAALLHDIGHILGDHQLPHGDQQDLDDHHEARGYQFLKDHFTAAVAEPVRLHVLAKRYLCTTRPDYEQQLSPTSRKSYHDQGGKMSADEQLRFESEPYFHQALSLRRWDDAAKDPFAFTPALDEFIFDMQQSLI